MREGVCVGDGWGWGEECYPITQCSAYGVCDTRVYANLDVHSSPAVPYRSCRV